MGQRLPFDVPAIAAVTLLAGDNGSGESTVVEALGAAIGFDRRGGETGRARSLLPAP